MTQRIHYTVTFETEEQCQEFSSKLHQHKILGGREIMAHGTTGFEIFLPRKLARTFEFFRKITYRDMWANQRSTMTTVSNYDV